MSLYVFGNFLPLAPRSLVTSHPVLMSARKFHVCPYELVF